MGVENLKALSEYMDKDVKIDLHVPLRNKRPQVPAALGPLGFWMGVS